MGNVHKANVVWTQINDTAEHNPELGILRNSVDAITDELDERNAFVLDDGQWLLSDKEWTDWLFSGAVKKYL